MTVAFRGRCVSEWAFAFGRALVERIIFSPVILADLFHGFFMMYGFTV